MTQEAEPIRSTLVDACNWFNKLSRLANVVGCVEYLAVGGKVHVQFL